MGWPRLLALEWVSPWNGWEEPGPLLAILNTAVQSIGLQENGSSRSSATPKFYFANLFLYYVNIIDKRDGNNQLKCDYKSYLVRVIGSRNFTFVCQMYSKPSNEISRKNYKLFQYFTPIVPQSHKKKLSHNNKQSDWWQL